MKIYFYDPFKTFPAFVDHVANTHHVGYVDHPLGDKDRELIHASADIVWYEFCTPELVSDMERIKRPAYTVCRLHSYELFTELPMQVNWDRVGRLLTVNPYVSNMLRRKQREIDFPPMDVLFNGVDLDKFTMPADKTYGKNICVLGFINHKKNLPFAIQCLDAARHGGYVLHFIGESQDRRYDFYLRHIIERLGLQKQVHFHGRIAHEALPEVLRQMDYIASFSLFESFGQGIMEGMASGCVPLVHDFPGANETFGGVANIFRTAGEFANHLKIDRIDGNAKLFEVARERRETLKKYSLATATADLDRILAGICEEAADG